MDKCYMIYINDTFIRTFKNSLACAKYIEGWILRSKDLNKCYRFRINEVIENVPKSKR